MFTLMADGRVEGWAWWGLLAVHDDAARWCGIMVGLAGRGGAGTRRSRRYYG